MPYSITIAIPDDLLQLVEVRRQEMRVESNEAMILELLAQALAQEELERKLMEGLEGEARSLAAEDWDAKRRDLIDRQERTG